MVISYDFKVDYNNIKRVFKAVLNDEDKKNIGSISLVYDTESGLLSGNLSMNMYFVTGTDKIYESPSLGAGVKVKKGQKNLFGTLNTSSGNDSSDEEDSSTSSSRGSSGSANSSSNSSSSGSNSSGSGSSSTNIGSSEVNKDN